MKNLVLNFHCCTKKKKKNRKLYNMSEYSKISSRLNNIFAPHNILL